MLKKSALTARMWDALIHANPCSIDSRSLSRLIFDTVSIGFSSDLPEECLKLLLSQVQEVLEMTRSVLV